MLNQAIFNREPLTPSGLAPLPLTAIQPSGWLRAQLERAAQGITGKLHEFWPDVRDSAWRGGEGDAWERAPYYLDGLVPLAYILEDERLIGVAKEYIEWTLASQRKDGQLGPAQNEDWWPRMVMLKVLQQYYTATADRRVPEFMLRYFAYQYKTIDERPLVDWAVPRAAENMHSALWLYNLTGRKFLIELCQKLRAQAFDWTAHFHIFPHTRPMSKLVPWPEMQAGRKGEGRGLYGAEHPYYASQYHQSHVVNVAMALKAPGVQNLFRSNQKELQGFWVGYEKLMKHHGVAMGMFTGDEHLSGASPAQGTECCAVVELMHTIETLLGGCMPPDGLGDLLEKLAFNALPATLTRDMLGHQYLQQANQVKVSVGKRNWYNNGDDANVYGLEPNYGCCTANLHQGWPKFAASLWYATCDEGFAAISYAPCVVRFWSGLVPVRIEVATAYPFEETVCITVSAAKPKAFPILLRIPKWAEGASIRLPDGEVMPGEPGGLARIEREWGRGEAITLTLPMKLRLTRWHRKTASVELGPLLMAYQPGEDWQKIVSRDIVSDWAVRASSPWNWALIEGEMKAEFHPEKAAPFGDGDAVKVKVQAAPVEEWGMDGESCAATPIDPAVERDSIREIELVPYGDTGLRIAQFPVGKVRP